MYGNGYDDSNVVSQKMEMSCRYTLLQNSFMDKKGTGVNYYTASEPEPCKSGSNNVFLKKLPAGFGYYEDMLHNQCRQIRPEAFRGIREAQIQGKWKKSDGHVVIPLAKGSFAPGVQHCSTNICICGNGRPEKGMGCPVHLAEACEDCMPGLDCSAGTVYTTSKKNCAQMGHDSVTTAKDCKSYSIELGIQQRPVFYSLPLVNNPKRMQYCSIDWKDDPRKANWDGNTMMKKTVIFTMMKTRWFSRFRPVPCRTRSPCHSPSSPPSTVHVTMSHVRFAESHVGFAEKCRMSDLRSVISDMHVS